MQDLQQTINMVLDYIRGIWIKKRYVMICSWLICPVGFFYVANLPDTYDSKAVVFVDTRSVLQPLLQGLTIQDNPQAEIQMMARTLLSRDNVEKIARDADLDITTTTEAAFEDLVTGLQDSIRLRGTGRSNIYTISYRHQQPIVSQRVVQETLNLFVEGALGNNRRGTDTADRFINEQIAEYENQLREAELRRSDFKRQYSDILPREGTFYSSLSALKQQLEQTQLEIKQTQQTIQSINAQLTRASSSDGLGVTNEDSFVLKTRYDERILALEERIDGLKLRFTERHPDVVEAQNLLDSLNTARQKEIDAFLSSASEDGTSAPLNELNRQLKLEISLLEGQVASLRVKEGSLINKINDLEAKIDLIPQIEAEETDLNRDYDVIKGKYEQLLSRRASADLSRRADSSSDELQFRIIEPPLIPNKPSGPKRLIMYTSVLLLGFGAGIALAFLISQLKPILVRGSQLSSITDYPIWGVVTHLDKANIKKKAKLRILAFIVSSGGVVSIYAVLVAAELMNINLLQRFVL
ncbi:chain-length determining protein [Alteromonas sediminis]|uniref:Chain-length determining protein n=1 Tax=Alteromonas sediminis TaxID=2259342 RepID=A0A3N5Y5Z1_9ALTE|nr:XrtA system polysaccharide chain length determinant [Alteromonas sediminis]RPJ65739.1 chain-length determining protein [Alteromonas sediminis]